MPSPGVVQFLNTASSLAQQAGVRSMVIAVRDPSTGELIAVASPAATADAGLRQKIADRLGVSLVDSSDTSWPRS